VSPRHKADARAGSSLLTIRGEPVVVTRNRLGTQHQIRGERGVRGNPSFLTIPGEPVVLTQNAGPGNAKSAESAEHAEALGITILGLRILASSEATAPCFGDVARNAKSAESAEHAEALGETIRGLQIFVSSEATAPWFRRRCAECQSAGHAERTSPRRHGTLADTNVRGYRELFASSSLAEIAGRDPIDANPRRARSTRRLNEHYSRPPHSVLHRRDTAP
jgi:hypothetical protein